MKHKFLSILLILICLPLFSFTGLQESVIAAQEDIIFFDGMQVPEGKFSTLGVWFGEWWWWMDGLVYELGAGYTVGTNAVKWEQTNGESNIIWGFASPVNLTDTWNTDSLKFKIKAPAETDTLILEFASGEAKVKYFICATNTVFDPETWTQVSVALKDFVQSTETPLDVTQVAQFSIYTLLGKGGITILLTDIWIGNPILHLPIVFFTGQVIPADMYSVTGWWTSWEWSDLSAVIESGAGPRPGTHAINWLQRDSWSGVLWVFAKKQDFTHVMPYDTLKFQINAPINTNNIMVEINSDKDHAVQYTLEKSVGIFDSTWHQVQIPLKNFTVSAGKADIDSTQINEFGIYTDNGTNGISVYLSEIWIGNPVLVQPDVDAPAAVENIIAELVEAENYYYNLVKWDDVAAEEGESYDVYVSPNPITDLDATEVEQLAAGLAEGKGLEGVKHYTFYPLKDGNMTYYYAVTCKDAAGNIGLPGLSSAITNKAMGIATISFEPPIFNADGDVYAWFKDVLLWPVINVLANSKSFDPTIREKLLHEIEEATIPVLSAAAQQVPIDESGILAVDWMNGRRTPDANQLLKGAITGLNLGSDAPKIFRSLAEATAFGAKRIVDRFISEGVRIDQVIALGGVPEKSPFVMQVVADILNMSIKVPRSEHTCAVGAAMFAATAAGLYPNVEAAQRAMGKGFKKEYHPHPQQQEKYNVLYEKYLKVGDFIERELTR